MDRSIEYQEYLNGEIGEQERILAHLEQKSYEGESNRRFMIRFQGKINGLKEARQEFCPSSLESYPEILSGLMEKAGEADLLEDSQALGKYEGLEQARYKFYLRFPNLR